MELQCKSITKQVLPAIRASIASTMHDKYGWRQSQIAAGLGVVQVAVSKYINRRSSKVVLQMQDKITKEGLAQKIAEEMAGGKDAAYVTREIDRLCEYVMEQGHV